MAHYDCWYCGSSMYDKPNCCAEEQRKYIESQVQQWAIDTAKARLREKHEMEIKALAESIRKSEDPMADKNCVKNYLNKLGRLKEQE